MGYNHPARGLGVLHISEPAGPGLPAYDVEPHGLCVCPGTPRDERECPRCHRPALSAERVAMLRARRR